MLIWEQRISCRIKHAFYQKFKHLFSLKQLNQTFLFIFSITIDNLLTCLCIVTILFDVFEQLFNKPNYFFSC